jgi:hypothetical protein
VKFHFAQRRTLWWPTCLGWATLCSLFLAVLAFWILETETFLGSTHRLKADVLVVEGWIGSKGVQAAKAEFDSGGYRYIVTANGLTENRWGDEHWVYALIAAKELLRDGVPPNRIIPAPPNETESQRTFESASAAWRKLRAYGITPMALNIFTLGPHARRSRLVYAKVFGPDIPVGMIAWNPASYAHEHWWRSSERASGLVKESAGYLFEFLFNSGRSSNHPTADRSPESDQKP